MTVDAGSLRYTATYSHVKRDGADRGAELRSAFLSLVRAWKAECLLKREDRFVGPVMNEWCAAGRVRFRGER